jgi:hypothetical protein
MSRNIPIPAFPNPPKEYDQRYMTEMIRSLVLYQRLLLNPGEGRNTFIVLTNLQTDDMGLEPGATFQVEGVVHVAILHRAYPRGASASMSAGQVTVSTS